MPVAACRRRTRRDEATTASVIGVQGSFVMAPVWPIGRHPLCHVRHQTRRSHPRHVEPRGASTRPPALPLKSVATWCTLRRCAIMNCPLHEGAMKIASLSLRNYTDDLVTLVASLDSPPLLVGHSLGGLLAQRSRHAPATPAWSPPAPRRRLASSGRTPRPYASFSGIACSHDHGASRCIRRRGGAVPVVDRQHPDRGIRPRGVRRIGLRLGGCTARSASHGWTVPKPPPSTSQRLQARC